MLGKYFGGPLMVEESLRSGLVEIGEPFAWNAPLHTPGSVVGVLNGSDVLLWAIGQKRLGNIGRLFAGPNIVVLPSQENGILEHKEIDGILVPSVWVKESYEKDCPELSGKIHVWPAGVTIPEVAETKKDIDFLVFNKTGESKIIRDIRQQLQGQKTYELLYGAFSQTDYFGLLSRSKYLVYVSESESQGLAMFEAWARNVPVLAWERGYAIAGNIKVQGKTSAPYMHDMAGKSFGSVTEFKDILHQLTEFSFSPRQYVQEYFSHEAAAKHYLEIVNHA